MCGIVAVVRNTDGLYTFLQDTLRSGALDGLGIYDRVKVTALLDSIPSMDGAGRGRADALLMWMASLCVLSDRLKAQAPLERMAIAEQ